MLYLGNHNKKPYIIHALWGYGGKETEKQTIYLLNKILVSGMFIGEDPKKGSLLKRTSLMGAITD
jgi:hypothetical protein